RGREKMRGPKGTGEQSRTWLTGAREAVDHVPADAIVHAGVALTLIHVHLAVCPRVALVERYWERECERERERERERVRVEERQREREREGGERLYFEIACLECWICL